MGQHEEDQGFLIRLGLSVRHVSDSIDFFSDVTLRVEIISYKFPILRRTPKGVWIKDLNEKDRFVLLEGKKRYAYPTMQSAYDSFIIRKRKEQLALEDRLEALKRFVATTTEPIVIVDRLTQHGHYEIQL